MTARERLIACMHIRFYVDGKLKKSGKPNEIETLRRWLNNYQSEWSKHVEDAIADPIAMHGTNQGREVTRVSDNELLVTTTEDAKLRWIIVE